MFTIIGWFAHLIFNYFYFGLIVLFLLYYNDQKEAYRLEDAGELLLTWPVVAWETVKGLPDGAAELAVRFRERRALGSTLDRGRPQVGSSRLQ